MQLIVLGMHRSGTSGVTRLLNLAGAWFGPPGIATEANEENPKGFWERRDVRNVCDGLLHGGGFDWYRLAGFSVDTIPTEVVTEQLAAFSETLHSLDQHRPWVVKEPRLCLLYPLIAPMLDQAVCVHVTREPLEVAHSVCARNGLSVQGALALWELYSLHAVAATAGQPRVHVRHEDVMNDPIGTMATLVDQLTALGVTGLHQPSPEEISEFISPDLHRQRRSPELRGLRLNAQQARLAELLSTGEIFGLAELPELSTGAAEELEVLERIDDLESDLNTVQQSLAAAGRREQNLERAIQREQARRRAVGETAIEALDRAERDVHSMVAGRPAKLAAYLVAIRRTLTPGMARTDPTPFSRALGGIERGRRQVRGRAADPVPGATAAPQPSPALISRSRPATKPTGKPRVAVISWDVGHNPLGRANVMAEVLARRFDVELWGAQFERYGSRVWAPLRDTPIPINVFPGRPFPEHLAIMEQVAAQIDADAIWVSKPRLPSYLLGALAKEKRNRPLVLDVDDHELAFFGEDEGIDMGTLRSRRGDPVLDLPFERLWTQACDPLIGSADQVTVSNVALQQRYGGLVVPHARDENLFDPTRFDRDEVRARLGVSPDQRLLLFGGTPRIHKGIVEVLRALEELGDERYRVLMFGTRELDELRPQIGDLARWAMALPYQPFRDLPSVLAAADLACVLQDATHPVARYQMPAKVTDALAMGVPCLVTPVPPLQPLIDEGVLQVLEPDASLAETITDIFDRYDDARHRAAQGRKLFLSTFSYEAVAASVVPVFEALIANPPEASPGLSTLTDVPRDLFESVPGQEAEPATGRPAPRRPGKRPRRLTPGAPFDVVMFWKQNDTGIYGRRQDMVLEYLQRSGRVGTVVHFDNPITPEALTNTWRRGAHSPADQGRLVVRQTLGRVGPRRRSGSVHRHTFVYGGSRSRRLGLPRRSGYDEFVRKILKAHGIGERPFVLWGYPTNPDLPLLIDSLDPDLVVADVVDDNRTWFTPGTPEHDRADLNYEQVLTRSDLVLANCDPVAQAMSRFAPEIHVIPNGLELPDGSPVGPRPTDLQNLTGPLIGYVGNLSSRIDIDLLDGLAEARPQWQFVFIGSAHLDASILRLQHRSNVHFLGVKPHQEARRYLQHFDVALIPHLDNEMTRAMNPLKAFVYCAAGVPVVSTPVANLGDLADLITVAHGIDGFLEAIEQNLDRGRQTPDLELLRKHSWEQRVSEILRLVDATVSEETGEPASSRPDG